MTEKLSQSLAAMLDALKEEPCVVAFDTAKNEYLGNTELQNKINEYTVQSGLLEQESKKTPRDELLITSIAARLKALYTELTNEPIMEKMQNTENELNEMLTKVSNGIRFAVYGEMPEEHSCGGDCGHCHSCD